MLLFYFPATWSGGEQEADFAHVSRVFSRMLSARRYVDVVATDVAAGLILLRHVQKAEVCFAPWSVCATYPAGF